MPGLFFSRGCWGGNLLGGVAAAYVDLVNDVASLLQPCSLSSGCEATSKLHGEWHRNIEDASMQDGCRNVECNDASVADAVLVLKQRLVCCKCGMSLNGWSCSFSLQQI